MNKYLFILGFAGMALFSACSTSDDLTAEEPHVTPPVEDPKEISLIAEARQDSEVPITLGVGQSRGLTRAPIGGEGDPASPVSFSTEPGKSLGVFCLATGYQSSYVDNPPIVNNWTDDDDTGVIVRMKNVAATVTGGEISFNDHDYYYPIGNWMKYNFYAYYPRQEETVTIDGDDKKTISFSNNQVLEKYYEIDGSQDIIWGMADPSQAEPVTSSATDAAPYCAKYVRLKKAESAPEDDYLPKLTFEHKLVQFRFFVKAADAAALAVIGPYNSETGKGMNMKVTDMFINNAIYRLSLVVANKNPVTPETPDKNGKLSMMSTLKTKKLGIKLHDKLNPDHDRFDQDGDGILEPEHQLAITKDAVDVSNVDENKIPTDAGYVGYIMLAPPTVSNDENFNYSLIVKLQYDAGSDTDTNSVAVSLIPPSDSEGFLAGKIYNIIVNVQSPERIFAKAVLNPWAPGGTYNY